MLAGRENVSLRRYDVVNNYICLKLRYERDVFPALQGLQS